MARPVVLATALCLGTLTAAPASAVPTAELPWTDRTPRFSREADAVRCAAVGAPDARLGRLSAVELRARYEGERRARAAIHRWADDAMADAKVMPWTAADVHRVVDEGTRVVGVRPMVDGGAVVMVEVAGEGLRGAASFEGAPWLR